ncbi:hypothetical protein [Polynucleobacter sp. MWH-UH35A]|uniref:hypothetical protein n=1 Tax=Polynucleobacter sp. MWH-UH35A TaxID=1855619 RepID=UPI001BFE151C|nr:hypothetical protein [Polynucleobacter sp. MWH-UH35A]QWD61039.1 hypothetical protein ICV36_05050 [Polynucleobacter sp. MWH-UH35A]
MNTGLIKTSLAIVITCLLCACSVAKLEARLEANPQCKDVINPKTGVLMPCPGSEKSFYREVGLAPAKPTPATATSSTPLQSPSSVATAAVPTEPGKTISTQTDCKPQIHKKTGGTLPCPAPD